MEHKIFDNDLVGLGKNKVTLTLHKLEYIEMFLLELSKVLMDKFHYNYTENEYSSNSRLLLTDTDGLMYQIKTQDVYKNFSRDKEMFDFSNYSSQNIMVIRTN